MDLEFFKKFKKRIHAISLGSLCELETQLKICINIGYLQNLEDIFLQTEKIKKMINALISSLKKDTIK